MNEKARKYIDLFRKVKKLPKNGWMKFLSIILD